MDCHWNYGVQAAIGLARAMEKYKLLWFEDPTPPENIGALGAVQRNTSLPVATGENHYFRLDFERLIVDAGLRVLAPDVQKLGLWEGRKIADLADMHYVNLAWHNISSPLGTMAGVHLCAATPNFLALEWHAASVPFFDALVKGGQGPLIQDGKNRGSRTLLGWASNSTKTSPSSIASRARNSSENNAARLELEIKCVLELSIPIPRGVAGPVAARSAQPAMQTGAQASHLEAGCFQRQQNQQR